MKLIKHQKVGSAITDSMANLSIIGIFQIVEEAVTELMGELKIDSITAKREYNAVWVFAKSKTRIYQNIAWSENYTVTCFISKITRVSVSVDVGIKNESDTLCAYSRVELCALDLQSGRIRRVSTLGMDDCIDTYPSLADISFTKFDAENLPEAGQARVQYTNIDFVGHTNNKEYIRFMLNTYSTQEMETRPIREMDVVYIGQSYENDVLTVRKESFPDNDILAVQKEDKTIVKCQIAR